MTRPPTLTPLFLTALLLGAAAVFGCLALDPSGEAHPLRVVAALAGVLWLAAAVLTGWPIVAYRLRRRRFRFALTAE